MNLNIAGHHLPLTNALRTYVSEKITRLERHFGSLLGASVILSVEKTRHKAEATIHTSGAKLHAEAIEEDMYAAIDALADKLDSQTRRHKEKKRDHHARDVSKGQPN